MREDPRFQDAHRGDECLGFMCKIITEMTLNFDIYRANEFNEWFNYKVTEGIENKKTIYAPRRAF